MDIFKGQRMRQITGSTNDILINETIKYGAINDLSQSFIWCRYYVPLVNDQIKAFKQDWEKPSRILWHRERHKQRFDV
ncbi:MAG: hypothetical protein EZS28_038301 [Streblomastix strix]|uniref:Uncharacterized protein n=1 Tax=Streblomastix strix TaxID=222440 RepID=A0A5J4U884_9EUKA|nr:MAG: hypothetical protein EZS28_038301 [Streblomastix strix]